jgi:hypothetical protein
VPTIRARQNIHSGRAATVNASNVANGPEGSVAARRKRRDANGWIVAIVLPACLAAACLQTLLSTAGYVLQVDAVFGPRPAPLTLSFGAPVALVLQALQTVGGGEWTGKLVLLGVLFLCGFGPMLLLRDRPWWARCAAALLGMLNPWVFDRIGEGQWGVVGAAGSLFLWLAAFEALQRRPGPRRAAAVALATVLVVSFSANFAGILAVLAVAAVVGTRVWRDPARLRWTAAAGALAVVALLYAVIPFFVQHGAGTYSSVAGFGRADWEAFRPTPDGRYGALPALAGLYGDWAERTGRLPVATSGSTWWPVTAAVLVGLAVAGALAARRRRWLLGAGVAGLALAATTSTSWGVDAAAWLSQRVPLLAAYRDTQKWLALWLVALVVLGAEAVAAPSRWARRPWAGQAAAATMALATLLPAGVNTLRELPRLTKPAVYPADWYAAADDLRADVPGGEAVAVLPWHLYEPLAFTGRLTANPAPVFFPGTLIVPNDPELPGQTAPPPSPGDIGALAQSAPLCALADGLRGMGVHWVVLEETVGADDALRRLRSCGFVVVEGGSGLTSVLHG